MSMSIGTAHCWITFVNELLYHHGQCTDTSLSLCMSNLYSWTINQNAGYVGFYEGQTVITVVTLYPFRVLA